MFLAGAFLCLLLLVVTAMTDAVSEQLDAMDAEQSENDAENVELA